MNPHEFDESITGPYCGTCGLHYADSLHGAATSANPMLNGTETPRPAPESNPLRTPWSVAEISGPNAPMWELTDCDGGHIAKAYSRKFLEYIAQGVNERASLLARLEKLEAAANSAYQFLGYLKLRKLNSPGPYERGLEATLPKESMRQRTKEQEKQ
jgi:hypothetical protein